MTRRFSGVSGIIRSKGMVQKEDEYHQEQRERIDKLEKEISILRKCLKAIEGKPKRGRPPKDKEKEDADTVI